MILGTPLDPMARDDWCAAVPTMIVFTNTGFYPIFNSIMNRALFAAALTSFLPLLLHAEELKTVSDFQEAAAKAHAILALPQWEQTPDAVSAAMTTAIKDANAHLDEIGQLAADKVTFQNTIVALDEIAWQATLVANRATVIKESNTDAAMREAGENAVKAYQDWAVGVDYREDVYKNVQAFAKTNPKLAGEDLKLLQDTLRDYRRAGLALPPGKRKEVEALRKKLASKSTDFLANVTAAQGPIVFTKTELEGVPESFLETPGLKTGDDAYTIMSNVTFQYNLVEDTARREETRKKLYVKRETLAPENIPLLNEILALRNQVALRLGYKSWADYQTEIKMAKSGAAASKFIDDLVQGIQPKFAAEVAEQQKLKAADTKDPKTQINVWDWRYYTNELKKTKYAIDAEALRVYFPYQPVLEGMFRIYQDIFGLQFTRIDAPQKWIDSLQLYVVTDAATGEPMGMFYLDMFPREGKFNHFAEFVITGARRLADGNYQRPVATLLCNFPTPVGDKPSLLLHSDVETLFHEFGHVMHEMMTRASYYRFAGTNTPGDFVEAPSQMLQNWVWDKKVLDTFAADYRDPSQKIPAETIEKMMEARLATEGMRYRRQFAFASLDLALHAPHPEAEPYDAVKISNPIMAKVFLPIDPDTHLVSYFGHLVGYDGGYYGYAWADAIAADMATVFQKSKDGYLDKETGLKLRHDIYEPGSSREVSESVEKFLGRKRSLEPFFKQIGIGK